jgi:hypothetical protein
MIFECHDLERALANPELMAEAQKHIRNCEACRNEYQLWNGISSTAKQLHSEWESPNLWPEIRRSIEAAQQTPRRRLTEWKLWAMTAAAAAIVLIAVMRWPQTENFQRLPRGNAAETTAAGRDFLTERALKEVEKNEAAYRSSIEELSRLAQPKLEDPASAPVFASYREQLLMLDSAISETRANVSQNQFNTSLQTELADLYRQKRQTLQEILTNAKQN